MGDGELADEEVAELLLSLLLVLAVYSSPSSGECDVCAKALCVWGEYPGDGSTRKN